MNGNGGAMTSGERFKGIETTLLRIEGKLDRKLDVDVLPPLQRRLEALESAESPLFRQLLRQWDQMQTQLADIVLHGSTHARLANEKLREVEQTLDTVREEQTVHRALSADRQTREGRLYRAWGLGVSLLAAAAMVASVLAYTHAL